MAGPFEQYTINIDGTKIHVYLILNYDILML